MRPLEPGDIFATDFRIERLLGRGGMGAVYVATQLSTGKLRALKIMLPEIVEDPTQRGRFEQEARIGARIASDHVVDVIAAGIDAASGAPWLGMELLDGEDLGAHVARRGPLPRQAALEIVAQLAHAMTAAHAAGVVHRDLKPDNIFIASAKREGAPALFVKVIDFGIAKLMSGAQPARTAPIGTLAWMAPEQADPNGEIGPATDVWALGLIVFFVLTGKHYWPLEAPLSVLMRKVIVDAIAPASARARELGCPEAFPAAFDGWFGRCVAREPEHRFQSAAAARAELERVLDPVTGAPNVSAAAPRSALAATEAAPIARRSRRWRIPIDDSPRRGPPDALVTIVELADFECPFSVAAEDVLREIMVDHAGDVALVWKDVPYDAHPSAHGAARFARLVRRERGDEGFWSAHDRLFASCPSEGLGDVERIASDLGLDSAAVAAALAGPDHPDTARDTEMALDFGAVLIPHFFVNGRRLVGVRALGRLRALVEEELATAGALVAGGVARAEVHEALAREAVGPPEPAPPLSFRPEPQRTGKMVGARARVDVHQFSDRTSAFGCLLERTLVRFLDEHGEVVRFHFHELADIDDPTSLDVAVAARASLDLGGDAGYWRMHALLVANAPQHPEVSTPSRGFARTALFQYAKEAGLHDAYFRLSFDNPERRKELQRTRQLATELGIAPGEFLVLVGGHRVTGLVVRELEHALQLALRDLGDP